MPDVPVKTTYLQLTSPGHLRAIPAPANATVDHVPHVNPADYRNLYRRVGEGFNWHSRWNWTDEEISAYFAQSPAVLYLLRLSGAIAGFFETLRHPEDRSTEIVFLGLLPEFRGAGLGKLLVTAAAQHAFAASPARVWLHTCTHDHPAALATYLARGFTVYDQRDSREPLLERPPVVDVAADSLRITWPDGHRSDYSHDALRRLCDCDACRPRVSRSRAVRLARACLLLTTVTLFAMLGVLCTGDAGPTPVMGLILIGFSIAMSLAGWRSRYPLLPWFTIPHIGMYALLIILVFSRHLSPRSAVQPFAFLLVPYTAIMTWLAWRAWRHPPPLEDQPTWSCKSCGYVLYGLGAERRCPECGDPFNPAQFPASAPPGAESDPHMTNDDLTPTNVDLKKNERLLLTWPDGSTSSYSISLLRTMCPCAMCRTVREGGGDPAPKQDAGKKTLSLNLLPGNFSSPLSATNAELVGNYALKIDWSDGHGSGIYSWRYLKEISRPDPV